MLLVVDIGNTNIAIGLFNNDKLFCDWRITTDILKSSDEYGIIFRNLINTKNISIKDIDGAIISSVVPPLNNLIIKCLTDYFNLTPLIVSVNLNTGLTFNQINPDEIGADRIVNAVASYELYKRSVIIVDLGTATTFGVISETGEYLGGAIAPGLMTSADALFNKAAKLYKIELVSPDKVIGKDTVNAMRSGIILGHLSLVDGIISRIISELGYEPYVVATGGLSHLIKNESHMIKEIIPDLTLIGLMILYKKNRLL